MQRSNEIGKLAEALAKAQGKIKGAVKDSENPFFRSHYADLAAVWDACREALSENGLAVFQTTDFTVREDGTCAMLLETTLSHVSGEWISGMLPIRPVKDDPQGMGSAITYARRYGLAAIVGIAQVDDDGNEGSGKPAVGTKEAAQEVAKQKIAELQAKVAPPSKSAEDFVKEKGYALEEPKPKEPKEYVEVQGTVGAVSPERKSAKGKPLCTVPIGETTVTVWGHDSELAKKLRNIKGYETVLRCGKKTVGDTTYFDAVEILGADLSQAPADDPEAPF